MKQKNNGRLKIIGGCVGAVVLGLVIGIIIFMIYYSAHYSDKAFEQSRVNAQQLDKLEMAEQSLESVESQTASNSHQIDLLGKDLRKVEKGEPLGKLSEDNELVEKNKGANASNENGENPNHQKNVIEKVYRDRAQKELE